MSKSNRESTVDWEMDIYAKGMQLNHWPYTEVISDVLNLTAGMDRSTLRFLEIGCGAGNNLWFAAASGFQVAGLDMSQTAIDYAKNRLNPLGYPNIELSVGDLTELPWPDDYFDIVIDRGALTQNSYERIRTSLKEVHRVLKSGGFMLAYTLYGLGDHDRKFGVEVAYNTYDHFTGGYFSKVGLTSFFDETALRGLFSSFNKVDIKRTISEDLSNKVTHETYSLSCRK